MAKKRSYRANRGGKERADHEGANYTDILGEYAPHRKDYSYRGSSFKRRERSRTWY
jgi:hypothetical protein